MAKGFTNAKTGSKLFAAIGVTYPEGSTCTCTDGVKSFAAKDTSGKWVFPIPYAASWTVTATDGTDTATQTVEITTQGQAEVVELGYDLILYKPGMISNWAAIARNIDGGSGAVAPSISANADGAISIAPGAYLKGGMAYYNQIVDLTDYRTLEMDGVFYQTGNLQWWKILGVWDSLSGNYNGGSLKAYVTAALNSTLTARRKITVDVSQLTGNHYVGFGVYGGDGKTTVYDLRLK